MGAQRLLHSTTPEGGTLKATVLSCYDLPNEAQPSCVMLELLGAAIETGPPLARHRERNSFKFFGGEDSGSTSELVVSAKLSQLYSSTATFRVKFSDQAQADLVAQFQISKRMNVNETKWLILNLRSATTNRSDDKDDASNATIGNIQPTLRVKMHLSGPYRPEIQTLINWTSSWFRTVDGLSDRIDPLIRKVTEEVPKKLPTAKYLLIPAVPITATAVVGMPVILGVGVIGFPLFLPLLVVFLIGMIGFATTGGALYFSTETGRDKMSMIFQPIVSTFLSTPTGQKVVYDVGPRPSPKSLAKFLIPQDLVGKLITSFVLDFIGSSSYLLPVVGEGFDLVWAPIYAVCIAGMYDEVAPSLKYLAFLEEVLPFTDIIPSATMGWVKEFGPGFLSQGQDQLHKWTVVARRERNALSGGRL